MTSHASSFLRLAQATGETSPNRRGAWFTSVVLLVAANWFVFWQVRGFDFLMWDDQGYVVRHMQALGGLNAASVRWAFTNNEHGWVTPLSYLSLLLDMHLTGLSPAAFHSTNALLHLATSLFVLGAMRRLTHHVFVSSLVAITFAVHPSHVEPVAWITGRWDVLCGLFCAAGLFIYAKQDGAPSRGRMLGVTLCYLCSLLSKPMSLPFPFVLLLLDYWPLARFRSSAANDDGVRREPASLATIGRIAILEKLPLYLLTALFAFLSFRAKLAFLQGREPVVFPFVARLGNAAETYLFYLSQFFWPTNLSFYYIHPYLKGEFSVWRATGAAIVVLLLTIAFVLLRRRAPALLVGWLWYLGAFVPALGLFQFESQATADRYSYLPSLGLTFAVMVGGYLLLPAAPTLRRATGICAAFGLLAFALLGRWQTSHWRNDEALNTHALRVDPKNFNALNNLGVVAARRGDDVASKRYYEQLLEIWPSHVTSYLNLGRIADRAQQYQAAIVYYRKAIELRPHLPATYFSLARDLDRVGEPDAALQLLRDFADQHPDTSAAWDQLGNFYLLKEDYSQAVDSLRRAMTIDVGDASRPQRLATALMHAGNDAELLDFCRSFLANHPQRHDFANHFAWLLATCERDSLRNGEEAMAIAEKLCHLSRFQNRFFLETLSAAYAEFGDFERAIRTSEQTIELAKQADDKTMVTAMRKRLIGYRDRKPTRVTISPRSPRSAPEPTDRSPQTDTAAESFRQSATLVRGSDLD